MGAIQSAFTAGGAATVLTPSGDTTGATDTAQLNRILEAGGAVLGAAGTFWINQTLQMATGAELAGVGVGATTIKAAAGFAPTQVGTNGGAVMLAAKGNTGQSHLTVSGLTFDMNQSTITTIPGYADGPECAPVSIQNASVITISDVEILNQVGYGIYLKSCTAAALITGCRVLAGAGSALGTNQQDAIHITDCAGVGIHDNNVDTGTGSAGDDGIALQSLSTGCSDISVTGNVIRSAQNGMRVACDGANAKDITLTGNVVYGAAGDGVFCDTTGANFPTGLTITGNTFRNIQASGIGVSSGAVNLAIDGNTIDHVGSGTGSGISVLFAGELSIDGNVITNTSLTSGITIGASAGAGDGRWAVTGNTVDLSGGGTNGIVVADSLDGTIGGNTVRGPTGSGTGIAVTGVNLAPTGLSISGNRVLGWATAILETNGGALPDYNTIVGNNCHGNTAFITTVGTHDVVASNVVA